MERVIVTIENWWSNLMVMTFDANYSTYMYNISDEKLESALLYSIAAQSQQ